MFPKFVSTADNFEEKRFAASSSCLRHQGNASCERTSLMSLTDLFIIYLSLGAPAAITVFFEDRQRSLAATAAKAVGVFLFWPPKTTSLLRQHLRERSSGPKVEATSGRGSGIDVIRSEILKAVKKLSLTESRLELRDIVERYVTLTREAAEPAANLETELFRVAGREKWIAGAACLSRRNAARLKRHQTDACRALFTAVLRFHSSGQLPPDAVEQIAILAGLLGDTATETGLRDLLCGPCGRTTLEGESCKSESKLIAIEPSFHLLSATTMSKID